MGKADARLVHADDVLAGCLGRRRQDQQLFRIAVGVVVQLHIAAPAADDLGGCRRDIAGKQGFRIFHLGLHRAVYLRDLLGKSCLGVSDLYAFIPLPQHVINSFHYLCRGGHIQLFKLDGDRIAESYMLQLCQFLVFLALPKRNEGQRNVHLRHTDIVVFDIGLCLGSQLCLRGLLLKIRREIHRYGPGKREVRRIGAPQDFFGQGHHRITFGGFPERADAGDGVGDRFFLRQVGDVLSVAQNNAPVGAAIEVRFDLVVVEFIFRRAVHVQHGACLPTKQRPKGGGHGHSIVAGHGLIRPDSERTAFRCVCHQTVQRLRKALRHKGHDRDKGKLVADVFRKDHAPFFQGLADPVNTESLRIAAIIGLGDNNAAHLHIVPMNAVNGILHLQLIGTVSFLGHSAADGIGQAPQPLGGESGISLFKQDRLHSVHHLGKTSMAIMPLPRVMPVFPTPRDG